MNYSIEIKGVTKKFEDITAVKELSLSVEKAEIFGLIGPDGAGKTSLFRLLTTLLLPNEGSITMEGFDVVSDYKKIRSMVGYMPGRFSLYQDLSVEENLGFYASVFGTDIHENYDLISDIYKHIEPFKTRRAGALSGGMKQKLALSCALIHRPEILILDEPTTGVDAVSRTEFWDLLHKIRKEGITILVSTPYMDEAERCDRVGLMQKGELMLVDKPGKVSESFKNPLVSVSIEGSTHGMLSKIRSLDYCRSAWLSGRNINVNVQEQENVNQLKKEMKTVSEKIICKQIDPGIEDAFIELMQSNSNEEKTN